jgi:hypothetical protein
MSTPVQAGSNFGFGNPTRVMDLLDYNMGNLGRDFDITPDGRRLLLLKDDTQQIGTTQIGVVENWFEDLKRLVPVN